MNPIPIAAAAASKSRFPLPYLLSTAAALSPNLSLIQRSSRFVTSRSDSPLSSVFLPYKHRRNLTCLSVVKKDEKINLEGMDSETRRRARPCELYICNLPRSYDISHLVELFKRYGTVLSVEVSRDPQTGISRGCGYVTMASISEAKVAITALDGSDVAGREMRVKFSVDMVSGKNNVEALNSSTKKNLVFESPYKIYVGNLSRSIRAQELMDYFSQFGTVVSTKVLHDRKRGKSRAYAFISFSTLDEVMVAREANGSELCGRIMSVREAIDQEPLT